MKMRSGRPAGAAAQADDLASLYLLAFLHFEFGKMQVKREQALAMVDHDEISFEVKRPGEQHSAIVHGLDWSSAGYSEIETKMWARCLAVKNSFGAEDIRNTRLCRS